MNGDHIDHFCSAIQLLNEGGSKITEPNAGITSDMNGRWTIGAFDTSKKNKKETPALTELIYDNNAGVMEIAKFFNVATPEQEDKLLNLMNNNKTKAAWNFIEEVLGIKFQGDGPWK
ncbi:MAG: hypothetical protein EBY83_07110 [Verrucomicrobia bacterium]|nr:hypothetical protein [Verrucomicrobiota bacterium]